MADAKNNASYKTSDSTQGIHQPQKHWQYLSGKIAKRQSMHSQPGKVAVARTTTEIAERLVASSSYDIDDSFTNIIGINDSTFYKYSGSRSSIFNYNHMVYDPIYYLDGSYIMGFGGEIGTDDHNNAPTILFDTAFYWYSSFIIDSFQYRGPEYALYDASQNVVESADLYLMDSTTSYPDNRFINTYNTYGNITQSLVLSWDMGVWDTSELRTFYYNTLNFEIKDSTVAYMGAGMWAPLESWQYALDDSGNRYIRLGRIIGENVCYFELWNLQSNSKG
jgi:hypothetical protein